VVGGDTIPKRKPDPDPLLHACWLLGAEPAHSFYVGDAERDIQAGKSAGMTALIARFGYLDANDAPEEWGAHGMIDSPEELLCWLDIPSDPGTREGVAPTPQTIPVSDHSNGQPLFCIKNTTNHE
jgi:phosphoglycolate phosphatase-like HAD superfamily hydrolase